MDDRTGQTTRSRALLLALVFVAPALLAGCATPHTHLDWNVRENPHRRTTVATKQVTPTPRRPALTASITPTPRPAWYQDTHPAPSEPAVEPVPAVVADAHFSWPVNGRVISEYGSTTGGERNDGINIAAAYGEPIHAAADGEVSYSGSELKSYGNLVLIKHSDNYVTAYAHAERLLVSRGDHVVKGQIIGYAGNTGDVSSPQLHFEIRRGVTPVNPRPLLGPLEVASR